MRPVEAFEDTLDALFEVESREVEAGHATLLHQTVDQPHGQRDTVIFDFLVVVLVGDGMS